MFRHLTAAAALLLALVSTPSARAVDESDLLPVEEAFALTATATSRDSLQLHWEIADGYYLYRGRIKARGADGTVVGELDLPEGKHKKDEFFGDVQTYRHAVDATLALTSVSGDSATVTLQYQGCADIGICYPPHRQTITVELPAANDAPKSLIPTTSGGFAMEPAAGATPVNPLTQALQGQKSLVGGTTEGPVVDELPLPEEEAFQFEAIALSPTQLLLRFTQAPDYYLYRDRVELSVDGGSGITLGQPHWPQGVDHNDEHFGKVVVYFDQIEVPLNIARTDGKAGSMTLHGVVQGCQNNGICYPPMPRAIDIDLPAASADELAAAEMAVAAENRMAKPAATKSATGTSEAGVSAPLALLLALLGGLILNLMPCVLPVLSLKVLGLASSGESHAKARSHALWYTAGVLLSMAAVGGIAIGLRAAGLALGWGFQLQQPLVVAALALIMLAVGLNLSGLFQIGAGITGVGQSLTEKKGASGDFFTGVLAVVVATPCTAPFMGSALAFAFTSPTWLALLVFLALGLGLALPFLLVGFVPALASKLPRPGAWMETFKQALAFPMYLTAAWLVWVLAKQRGADAVGWALIASVALALAAWALSHWQTRRRPWAVLLMLIGLLGAGTSLWQLHQLPTPTANSGSEEGVEAYDAKALERHLAEGRVVFVNMTADWCVTCKANEKAVLSTDAFADALKQANAVYMKGDWTNVDPEITAFLDAHNAVGVPLYVVYPRGGGDGIKLPAVLTVDTVTTALRNAAQ
ncbi:MAG: protein-disulfide reductase DsbD [Xanthomonadales bacterium]|nr:protein-disulfide reductase DsbD [Xanthomonadales bacterium]